MISTDGATCRHGVAVHVVCEQCEIAAVEAAKAEVKRDFERVKVQPYTGNNERCETCFRPHDPVPGKAAPFVPLAIANSKQRKMMPVTSGCLDYFPDALAAVAYMSYLGNQKHNPGEPTHWARGKSDDHIDCVARHLLRRDDTDAEGIMEGAEMVWRALAWLQLKIEKQFGLPPSRGSS